MSKNRPQNSISAKILDVYRNRSNLKTFAESKQHLLFKIKPQKSKSQLLVTYDDLRKYFPLTLLQFYENKIVIKQENNGDNNRTINQISQIGITNNTSSKVDKKVKIVLSKNAQHKQKKQEKKATQLQQKNKKQHQQNHQQQINNLLNFRKKQLIFDYDKLQFDKQIFQCAFPGKQGPQNPYIKELNNYQNYKLNKLYDSDDDEVESQKNIQKKKKGKILI